MPKVPNIRTLKVPMGSGKMACESSQLNGEAKPTKAWNETNNTDQYKTTGSTAPGPHGGKANYGS